MLNPDVGKIEKVSEWWEHNETPYKKYYNENQQEIRTAVSDNGFSGFTQM